MKTRGADKMRKPATTEIVKYVLRLTPSFDNKGLQQRLRYELRQKTYYRIIAGENKSAKLDTSTP